MGRYAARKNSINIQKRRHYKRATNLGVRRIDLKCTCILKAQVVIGRDVNRAKNKDVTPEAKAKDLLSLQGQHQHQGPQFCP